MGAPVDTCYYHSWPRVRALLDSGEDSSNGEEEEQEQDIIAV